MAYPETLHVESSEINSYINETNISESHLILAPGSKITWMPRNCIHIHVKKENKEPQVTNL